MTKFNYAITFLFYRTSASFGAPNVHIMSNYSIFCFLLIFQRATRGLIYSTLFKPFSQDRIVNFLLSFSLVLITTVPKQLKILINQCSQHSCKTIENWRAKKLRSTRSINLVSIYNSILQWVFLYSYIKTRTLY